MSSVTVVVPTFNRARYLGECLDSLLDQTVPPSQIIVVDDGSTDDTPSVVAQFGDRITYLRKHNAGKSAALNYALPHVVGDFVWFFDDDDVAYPEAIESHLKTHECHPEIDFSFGFHDWGVDASDGRIQLAEHPAPPKVFLASVDEQRVNLLKYCAFMLCACVSKTEAVRKLGGFREDFLRSQDYEFLIRLSQGGSFCYTGSRTYIFRRHGGERGPTAIRHKTSDRRVVWSKFDHLLGQSILASVPLGRYLLPVANGPDGTLSALQQREALIRRASVMASKTNVPQAVSDLVQATKAEQTLPLNRNEIASCESLPDHPYFVIALSEQPLRGMRHLLSIGRTRVGRAIQLHLAKGLYRQGLSQARGRSLHEAVLFFSWGAALLMAGGMLSSSSKGRMMEAPGK